MEKVDRKLHNVISVICTTFSVNFFIKAVLISDGTHMKTKVDSSINNQIITWSYLIICAASSTLRNYSCRFRTEM